MEARWKDVPIVILVEIFILLPQKERYNASLTCKNWLQCFYLPRVWERLVVQEHSFARRKFSIYKGVEYKFNRRKLQQCLERIGSFIKKIVILPISDHFYLFEFMNVLNTYLAFSPGNPMPQLRSFEFTFFCESRGKTGSFVYGSGGNMLKNLKELLSHLPFLTHLSLKNILLSGTEAQQMLADVLSNCGQSLNVLEMMNTTSEMCPLFQIGMFRNLHRVVVSPQQIDDDLIITLAHKAVPEIYVVQDQYIVSSLVTPVSPETWLEARRLNPQLCVKLLCIGRSRYEMVWQEKAPVVSIIYDSPYALVTASSVHDIISRYGDTLEEYGNKALPRLHGGCIFHDRVDANLLLLVRGCPKLHTLIIRDRVSTASIVLIVSQCAHLKRLYVRQNAILKRMDWSKVPEWSSEFYYWLKSLSRSYESMQNEVSKLMGYSWRALTDTEFLNLTCGNF